MDRIRKYNCTYQVLITPTQSTNVSTEMIFGDWTSFDNNVLTNYNIITFDTMKDALNEAAKYPNIDWAKIVVSHENSYIDIKNAIIDILKQTNINYSFSSKLESQYNVQNMFFDRIFLYKNKFNLSYHMSDIISFSVKNKDDKNICHIAELLMNNNVLNIKKTKYCNNKIKLIGVTCINTTFQIVIE